MAAAAGARGWIVRPSRRVAGDFTVPGDKSISHRALMLGGIARGSTRISGFLSGEDCLATLRALAALGVTVRQSAASDVEVDGRGVAALRAAAAPLDMGNAGTAMRLFMGLLSARPFDSTLVGDASLMRRPMERAAAPLRQMGAHIETQGGRPPVRIHGGAALKAIDYVLPVASAQVKSALLLAALDASGTTRVTEPAPTRDHTERMLRAFGVAVDCQGPRISIEGGQSLVATRIDVPADFSSAAFFIVAGLLGQGNGLTIRNVGVNPTRTGLLEILRAMGGELRVLNPRVLGGEPVADIEVLPGELRGITVEQRWVPLAIDELPVFFIAAACARGESLLRGARELRVKESDRLAGMSAGLAAVGVEHELLDDGMRILGRPAADGAFSGGTVDSHGDHRVAMSFAVASLRASAPIRVRDVANVATSFPGFANLARSIGLDLEETAVGQRS
jgi:3-phosphoshikimate 1-carboxyvinyltransferase